MPLCGDFAWQRPQFDEALRVRLIEGVTGVVGGKVKVIEALIRHSACDHGNTGLQLQANVARDVTLGVRDERIKAALEVGEPQAVID